MSQNKTASHGASQQKPTNFKPMVTNTSVTKRDFRVPLKENANPMDIHRIPPVSISRDDKENNQIRASVAAPAPSSIQKFYPMPIAVPTIAEQGLVTDGQKSSATFMIIKVKNAITRIGKEALQKSIECVYEKKAVVYEQGDFLYIIFTPLITKTFKNEITASRCGEKIVSELKEFNGKFKDKIDFGIGINSGEIINKIEDKKLKFTALGNLLPIAKRLADAATETVYLSKPAYEKAMTEIKAEKKNINGTDAYEVRQIVDYEKNRKFIDDFLRRDVTQRR